MVVFIKGMECYKVDYNDNLGRDWASCEGTRGLVWSVQAQRPPRQGYQSVF
eukprot:SAG25_NODE_32_length_20323_cov_59.467721_2_plen_51_part_00